MEHPQTKFHAHTMRECQVIRSKLIIGSSFLAAQFFSVYR